MPLAVSGPFHSQLMQPAAEVFERHLRQAAFADPKVPVVTNVGARLVRRKEELEQLLARQLKRRSRVAVFALIGVFAVIAAAVRASSM